MTTALAKNAPASITLKTQRATDMLLVLQEESEVRALVRQFVHEQMVQGTDYGVIPGTKEPTLLKPGAEKLFDLFRCKPEYEVMHRTVDVATGFYAYEIRCKAVGRETGIVVNEGMGSASSYESRYRYRNAGRSCPSCGKQTITRSKFKMRREPEGTPACWWCNAKNGGCGSEFSHDDPAITGQETGKITNPDLADVANTVLKIAKKRAQVDCAIGLARVSDLFTQDLDDLPTVTAHEPAAPSPAAKVVNAVVEHQAQAPAPEAPKAPPPKAASTSVARTALPAVQTIFDRLVKDGCKPEAIFSVSTRMLKRSITELPQLSLAEMERIEKAFLPAEEP